MADSVREQLITAIVEALSSSDGNSARVVRSLTEAQSATQLPVMAVLPSAEDISRGDHDSDQRVLTVRVVLLTADPDTDGGAIDQKADSLLQFIESVLLGNPTFDGLASWTEISHIDWSMEDSDQDYLGATLTAQVTYCTQRGNPAVVAE